jgi:hypothetical protein
MRVTPFWRQVGMLAVASLSVSASAPIRGKPGQPEEGDAPARANDAYNPRLKPRVPNRERTSAGYPNAFFTRCEVIGVSRNRTPASSATALAMAGATSGVAIWPTPVGWLSVATTLMAISGISFMRGT